MRSEINKQLGLYAIYAKLQHHVGFSYLCQNIKPLCFSVINCCFVKGSFCRKIDQQCLRKKIIAHILTNVHYCLKKSETFFLSHSLLKDDENDDSSMTKLDPLSPWAPSCLVGEKWWKFLRISCWQSCATSSTTTIVLREYSQILEMNQTNFKQIQFLIIWLQPVVGVKPNQTEFKMDSIEFLEYFLPFWINRFAKLWIEFNEFRTIPIWLHL